MRVVVDALGVQRGGGLLTAVRSVVGTWAEVAPGDELVLVVDRAVRGELPAAGPGLEVVPLDLGSRRQVNRLTRGAWALRELSRGADALLATLPVLPTFGVRALPTVVLLYDMRHRVRPTDFPRATVLQRSVLYHRAVRRSDAVLAISQRTADDLDALIAPHAPVTVAHLGADHVAAATTGGARAHGLVHGHFSNKGVDLALQTWATLGQRHAVDLPLLVVGVPPEDRGRWESMAGELGIGDRVRVAGWLDDGALASVVDDSAVLLFPSRHEGFGLPALEAMRRRVPVAISPDPALVEVTGGHAPVASSWSAEALAEATWRAIRMSDDGVEAAARHAATFTWASTVTTIRAVIEAEVGRRSGRDGGSGSGPQSAGGATDLGSARW